jgi:hypothetical protein
MNERELSNAEVLGWLAMTESEVNADENGVPSSMAARDGIGLRVGDDDEVIRLSSTQVRAMRVLGKQFPLARYIDDHLEEMNAMKEEMQAEHEDDRKAFEDAGVPFEEAIGKLVMQSTMDYYLLGLAGWVQAAPSVPGLIDHYKGRNSRAARLYKEWEEEQASAKVSALVKETGDRLIEEGVFESVVIDGVEYLRYGPNYEKWRQEREAREE